MTEKETSVVEGTEAQAGSKANSDYEVGYCKPPKEHWFKPGNNAYPRGRKRGSRNRKLVVEEALFELISVREGDKVTKMTVLEAVLKKTARKALAGDHKAAFTMIGLAQKNGLLTPEQNEIVEEVMSESDKAILADYTRRLSNPEI